MANTKSGTKSAAQADRRRVLNVRRTRALKSTVKEVRELLVKKDTKAAEAALPKMFKALDKAAKHGTIKKGAADRKKSRIAKALAKSA